MNLHELFSSSYELHSILIVMRAKHNYLIVNVILKLTILILMKSSKCLCLMIVPTYYITIKM